MQSQCREWEAGHQCKRREECWFIHAQKPWREELSRLYRESSSHTLHIPRASFVKNTRTKHVNIEGKSWWTAGYGNLDREKGLQEVFYAEGGLDHTSPQGVSWYETESEALKALERVMIVSVYARRNNITPQSFQREPPSQIGWSQRPRNDPHSRTETDHYDHYGPSSSSTIRKRQSFHSPAQWPNRRRRHLDSSSMDNRWSAPVP